MATDYTNPEMLNLDRQRALSQMLLKQGMQTPQGQMIGNIYVGASPWQFLGNLAQQYIGSKIGETADTEQIALAKKIREQEMGDITQGMQLFQGTPGKAGIPEIVPQGQTLRDDQGYLNLGSQAGVAEIPATAPNPQAAMARLLGSQGTRANALGSEIAKQLFKEPKWEKSEKIVDGNKVTGFVNLNSPTPEATFRAGSVSPDLDTAKARFEGYLPATSPANNAPANFSSSVNKVLSFEGGYVAKDGKSGAPANFGINQKFNPDIDVSKLTKEQAVSLYKTRYWDAIGADNLPAKTAEIAFDAAVNQGPAYAKQLLAQTNGDPARMLQQRAIDYTKIVQNDPSQAQYLSSWMNRLQVLGQDGQSSQPVASTKVQQQIDIDKGKRQAEYAEKAPAAMQFMNNAAQNIDAMIGTATVDSKGNIVYGKEKPHAGFAGAVGASGIQSGFGAAGFIPGTDVSDFKARFKQLEGQGFLQAFESLKGVGQITEIEGAKATAALNRMSLSTSEKEFIKAAREFQDNLKQGIENVRKRAGLPNETPGQWSVISVTPSR